MDHNIDNNINSNTNDNVNTEINSNMQIPPLVKADSPMTAKWKENAGFFAISTFLYACFYALCMYRNKAGITYPFFVAGSLLYYYFCMQKLEISFKKGSIFTVVSILLLGISTMCTADMRIVNMNKTGVLVLTLSLLLHQIYKDENWNFGRYLAAIFSTFFGGLRELGRPFTDISAQRKLQGKKETGKGQYVFIGLLISVPLFLIILALLLSADRVFRDMTIAMIGDWNVADFMGIVLTILFMFYANYCIGAGICEQRLKDQPQENKRTDSILALTIITPIALLYVVFSVIQVKYLFLGQINLDKYSYATYARQGFFQLLAVCVINLILVLITNSYFRQNMVLKIVMTIVSACTYIMIASSAMRMIYYIQHYYLTFLRLFVLWALALLFLLLTGVIVSIYRPDFKLFKYCTIVVTLCYLALSFSHPDYWIAKCNISNTEQASTFFDADGYHDYGYLSRLSADAAPALIPYLQEEGYSFQAAREDGYLGSRAEESEWGLYYLRDRYEEADHLEIRNFNFSRFMVKRLLEEK